MRKKIVLLSVVCLFGTSCREDNTSVVEKENVNSQSAKISLSSKLDKGMIDNYSREYGKILRYVTDTNKNLKNVSEINKSVNTYILNNSQIFDVRIIEQKHLYVAKKEKIALPLDIERVIWNSDDSFSSIITNLEKYKQQEISSENYLITSLLIEYLSVLEDDRGHIVRKASPKNKCIASTLGGFLTGAVGGCGLGFWGGPAGCVIGGTIGAIGGALTSWGNNENC